MNRKTRHEDENYDLLTESCRTCGPQTNLMYHSFVPSLCAAIICRYHSVHAAPFRAAALMIEIQDASNLMLKEWRWNVLRFLLSLGFDVASVEMIHGYVKNLEPPQLWSKTSQYIGSGQDRMIHLPGRVFRHTATRFWASH